MHYPKTPDMAGCQVHVVAMDFELTSRIACSEPKRTCCTCFHKASEVSGLVAVLFCKQDVCSWIVAILQDSMPSVVTHLLHAFKFSCSSGCIVAAPCFPCMQESCSSYSIVLSQHALRLGAVDHHQVLLMVGHGLILCVVCVLRVVCGEREGLCPADDSLVLSPAHVYR